MIKVSHTYNFMLKHSLLRNMTWENIILDYRLSKIDKTRNYLLKEIKKIVFHTTGIVIHITSCTVWLRIWVITVEK